MPIKHTRHGNHLLAALPDEDFDRLAPHLTEQPFPKGYILQQRDEPLHLVYFPDSSLSGLICPTEDGSNTQVAMVGREGMVGVEAMFGSRVAMCDAVIHSTDEHLGHVMTIDAFHREMNRHGALYSVARQYTGALMVSLARWVACNASHSAEQRCCRWLLEATFRIGTLRGGGDPRTALRSPRAAALDSHSDSSPASRPRNHIDPSRSGAHRRSG